ncbi:hypothetical protein FDF18_02710 [Clostridium sporogenes]|uniref:Uncharacterized protein n=1 Tax=Clostridium sporogenes TaxID=1509 RepID=A0A6G4GV16_CLOSG|nr:hypothetical protein [Clostridium sporogenes]NFT02247.1 hypothetical protein [Clostridium sporogenes]NFT32637.1 hypothetical protein [Clostridium sporogenes]NFT52809.1 hypothetical protein [Clostridium sporogenes]
MDINKIAKEMTREEFLKRIVIDSLFTGYDISCPSDVDLETVCDLCKDCKECWENAIKDIKFKGEDNMKFDWEGFKNNDFAVLCDTEEKAKDFLKECYKRGLSWSDGKSAENYIYYKGYDTCYTYNFNNWEHLQYSSKSFYLDNGYKVIEWEIENKIDYDREYNIMEIMEFPEETEIKNQYNMFYKISNNDLYYKEDENRWVKSDVCLRNILNMKFKLVKKDKKVSFKEAIQAYGKEIYCIWIDTADMKHKSEYKIYSNESILKDQNEDPISPVEIFEGEWYIKED